MPNLELIAQFGSTGAVIYVVILFLKQLDKINKERDVERKEWLAVLIANQKSMDLMVEKCTGKLTYKDTRRQDASSLT